MRRFDARRPVPIANGSIDPRFGSSYVRSDPAKKSSLEIVSGMEVYMFLLVLGHILVLFASAIAVALFIVTALIKGLWRLCTAKSRARELAKHPQRKYFSQLPQTAAR